MTPDGSTRRELLLALAATPLTALASPIAAAGQAPGQARKVDTRGLTAAIKFESPLAGYLTELKRPVQAARDRAGAPARGLRRRAPPRRARDPASATARAEPGVLWSELDARTQAAGLATTGGIVTHTGSPPHAGRRHRLADAQARTDLR